MQNYESLISKYWVGDDGISFSNGVVHAAQHVVFKVLEVLSESYFVASELHEIYTHRVIVYLQDPDADVSFQGLAALVFGHHCEFDFVLVFAKLRDNPFLVQVLDQGFFYHVRVVG